MSRSH